MEKIICSKFMNKFLFKENKLRKIGWIIAILNILVMLNSMNYFLFMAKFPIIAWLVFNICFPSTLFFLIGFFSKNRAIMIASIPFLAYFGIGGLFVFGWTGTAIFSQIGHIFMTLAIVYAILEIIRSKEWKNAVLGFSVGLIAFFIILPIQQNYSKNHPEFLKKLGDPKFEKMMEEK